jgi:parallel beta-helix repeat protein
MRTRSPARVVFSLSLVVAAALGGYAATAGPLDPPAGTVGPTYKTLTEVEPRVAIGAAHTPGDADSVFKVTQPGSYYLVGNVAGVASKHGIEITSGGVTLDLNGFELAGVAGSLDGVSVTAGGVSDVAVIGGTVRGWGGDGIDLGTLGARHCGVSRVVVSGNAGSGITSGQGAAIVNCSAHNNGGDGLQGTSVAGCSAYTNGGHGIIVNGSASECWAAVNGVSGSGDGIFGVADCTISECTASSNASGAGIRVGDGATVTGCSASGNGVAGIIAGAGCTASGCSTLNNTGTVAVSLGVSAGAGSAITGCTASGNHGNGISVGIGSTVDACTARFNSLDGILCSSASAIRGNTCSNNGVNGQGSNVHATASDNTIEGNTCSNGNRGVLMDAAGNVIVKNVCSGNVINWAIAANNVCGPIVDRTAPASGAINGNSAPSSLGTAEPNANFTY